MFAVVESGENYTKVLSEVRDLNEAVEITKKCIMLYARDHPEFSIDADDTDDLELLNHYCLSDKNDLITYWNDNIANTYAMYDDGKGDVFHPCFYFEKK